MHSHDHSCLLSQPGTGLPDGASAAPALAATREPGLTRELECQSFSTQTHQCPIDDPPGHTPFSGNRRQHHHSFPAHTVSLFHSASLSALSAGVVSDLIFCLLPPSLLTSFHFLSSSPPNNCRIRILTTLVFLLIMLLVFRNRKEFTIYIRDNLSDRFPLIEVLLNTQDE